MAEVICRTVPAGVVEECFNPRFVTERKVRGRFEQVERALLPGYIIAITNAPLELNRYMHELPEFARVLVMGDRFAPLREDEAQVIAAFTDRGDRVVPMSTGIKDGDRVVVVEGPLVGHEGMIDRIDRRRGMAYLRFQICGRTVETRVGLAVVNAADTAVATARKARELRERARAAAEAGAR